MLVFYFYFSFFLLGHKGGGVFITVAGYSKKKRESDCFWRRFGCGGVVGGRSVRALDDAL